ncbi:MAG: pantoate--beta-alanine ligase [Acidobacteria bacterium]|nr:MAG: pantoate--beta-alanine ligase [Acidobacteriota bacterium]
MQIFKTIQEMRAACSLAKGGGQRLGLVPTMGALHEGHLSLVRTAKAQCDAVAASIFVNPTQFGPNEDFAKYPRSFERDCEILEQEAVDLLFAPAVEEMYPQGMTTWVTVEGLSDKLCGKARPGHFRGVTTVVAKLFQIVQPDAGFFGQKDAAQLAIIRRMVRDLNFAVEIVACPVVREPDGLAMSSRNAYLDPQQRRAAPVLYRSLLKIQEVFKRGEHRADKLIDSGKQTITEEHSVRLDYLEIVDPDTLDHADEISKTTLVAIAGYLGSTRLIDNIHLSTE